MHARSLVTPLLPSALPCRPAVPRLYDEISSSSNYGANTVHIAAPGQLIFSTTKDGSYAAMQGTSQAAPMVSLSLPAPGPAAAGRAGSSTAEQPL